MSYKSQFTGPQIDEKLASIESIEQYINLVEQSIPTKVSQLDNDQNYVSAETVANTYASKEESNNILLAAKDYTDTQGFLTEHQDISHLATQNSVDQINTTILEIQETNTSQQSSIIELQNRTLESMAAYGVEWDTSKSSTTCTRIGNMELHRTLPVHSRLRGCLLDDDGNVIEYLPADDWTSAVRDGSKGQVMVEIPDMWRKFVTNGTKVQVWHSLIPLTGYHEVKLGYISAYEASLQRSTLKLSSVVNMDVDYRGGNNTSGWDDTYRSLLGRPVTSISRGNFRTYARNRNEAETTEWNLMTYEMQKTLYWLFVTEYATLNTQATYNAELTIEGYHQGGLGTGVTNWSDANWSAYNSYNPFVPCGHTDSLGNNTGTVNYSALNSDGTIVTTSAVPRYRGIENPFGHIWQHTDGINIQISPTIDNGGDGLSKIYTCNIPSKFNDENYDGYTYVGNEARSGGYVKTIVFGNNGEIIPSSVGGSNTTYYCDYHYTNITTSEALRCVLFGGNARDGARTGLVCANSNDAPSYSAANIGSHLCFFPSSR